MLLIFNIFATHYVDPSAGKQSMWVQKKIGDQLNSLREQDGWELSTVSTKQMALNMETPSSNSFLI